MTTNISRASAFDVLSQFEIVGSSVRLELPFCQQQRLLHLRCTFAVQDNPGDRGSRGLSEGFRELHRVFRKQALVAADGPLGPAGQLVNDDEVYKIA